MSINVDDNILFARIGWMKNYDGLKGDSIAGGGEYVEENNLGWEIYNFANENGIYQGYVETKGSIDIQKNFQSDEEDDYIDNATVVWLATNPNKTGTKIIGWYKNATIYKKYQEALKGTKRYKNEHDIEFVFNIEAKVKDSKLLPIDERTFTIPNASANKAGIGQSNVWYCNGEKNKKLRQEIVDYINNYKNPQKKAKEQLKNRGTINIEKKQKVEKNAIDYVKEYYSELGYKVKSVEKDNVGWDLEANKQDTTLYIEVKGLSQANINAGLTPNEYKHMNENKDNYRLAIVTNALNLSKITLNKFMYSGNNIWEDDEGQVLKINEIVAANVFVED